MTLSYFVVFSSKFYKMFFFLIVNTWRSHIILTRLLFILINNEYQHRSSKWLNGAMPLAELTHWGPVMHICVSKLTINGSNNYLSPDRRQAIIWTNAGILLIGPLRTNFSEISISKFVHIHSRKCMWKCRLESGGHFLSASMFYGWQRFSTSYIALLGHTGPAESILRDYCKVW